jgi:hypothetical protein
MKLVSKINFTPVTPTDLQCNLNGMIQKMAADINRTVDIWLQATVKAEKVLASECELHVTMYEMLDTYTLKKDGKLVGIPFTINHAGTMTEVKDEPVLNETLDEVPIKEVGVRTERTIQRPAITWGKKKRG